MSLLSARKARQGGHYPVGQRIPRDSSAKQRKELLYAIIFGILLGIAFAWFAFLAFSPRKRSRSRLLVDGRGGCGSVQWMGRPLHCCGAQKNACERMLTPYSGCIIADWTYRTKGTKKVWWGKSAEVEDCDFVELERIVDHGSMIRANESVYVPYETLHDFVERVLPEITAPFVLITGTYQVDPHIAATTYDYFLDWAAVLQHPYLLHLYNMNPWFRHPKQSGWPYGIMRPLKYEPFYDAAIEKNETGLYFGPLGLSNLGRLGLPGFLGIRKNTAGLHASHAEKSSRVPFKEYAQLLASHQFVLSPDGDRKDCARNYEALGLGTQPVTDLDIRDYDFYKNCGLIFDEDLNDWENLKLKPARVERRVVLNEYWASKLSHAIRTRDFRLHC